MNNKRYTTNSGFDKLDFVKLEQDVKLLFEQGNGAPRSKHILVVDTIKHTQHKFTSIVSASKFCSVSVQTISNYRDTGRLIYNRYLISTTDLPPPFVCFLSFDGIKNVN